MVKDIFIYRNMDEDTLTLKMLKLFIDARIAGEVQNQVIGMDVDEIITKEHAIEHEQEREPDWANSLAAGPRLGAVGQSGMGSGKGWGAKGGNKDNNGKDKSDERPAGACSHCWGFGHYYRACPRRLGPEAAAAAEKEYEKNKEKARLARPRRKVRKQK